MKAFLTLAMTALSALPVQADSAGPGGRVQDCFCTDTGGARVEMGQEICLIVDGRAFMARCEMALNNPIWRETGTPCLSSQNRPMSLPVGKT